MKSRVLLFLIWLLYVPAALIGQPADQIEALLDSAKTLRNEGQYREALPVAQAALDLADSLNERAQLGTAYVVMGRCHKELGHTADAGHAYMSALAIRQSLNDQEGIASVYNNLASLRELERNFEEGIDFSRKAIHIWDSLESPLLANGYNNLANLLGHVEKIDSAIYYNRVSISIASTQGDTSVWADGEYGLANRLLDQNEMDSASVHYRRAEMLFREKEFMNGLCDVDNGLGNVAFALGNLDSALFYYQRARSGYASIADTAGLCYAYYNLYQLYESQDDFDQAALYLDSLTSLPGFMKYITESVFETSSKYTLEVGRGRKKSQNGSIVLGVLLVGGIIFWMYWNQKKKREEADLKNKALEANNQKLLAEKETAEKNQKIEELINKHVQERQDIENLTIKKEQKRIGHDLHEKINPLFAVKWTLESMSSRVAEQDPNIAKELDEAVGQISSIHNTIRNISHTMSKSKSDWLTELKEYGKVFQGISNVKISINFSNALNSPIINTVSDEVGFSVQKIAQNLISNAIKHSKAKNLLVNITAEPGMLRIGVEDDGVGFDPEQYQEGLGLQGVKEEVSLHAGTWVIHSQPGEGTSIFVEIPLPSEDEEPA